MPGRDMLQAQGVAAGLGSHVGRSESPSPRRPGLSAHGVRKGFGRGDVLRGIDLEIPRGEVVALLGPNGAGKSTLLRILVGTITADAGEILIDGHDTRRDSEAARREISWVLGDEHGWYWRLSGRDNLVFFAMLRGARQRKARAQAAAELERHGLLRAADTPVAEYSTGMRARLALARASLAPTALVVLDEPGRGLDVAASEWLAEYLRSLTDSAVLLVTHDLDMVSDLAERSVVMHDGLVRMQFPAGTPARTLAAAIATASLE
jgi:ABC-type multidrug transport system ATPase subunit